MASRGLGDWKGCKKNLVGHLADHVVVNFGVTATILFLMRLS